MSIVGKEVALVGTHRFHAEFAEARGPGGCRGVRHRVLRRSAAGLAGPSHLDRSREQTLDKLLFGLGIRHVGEQVAGERQPVGGVREPLRHLQFGAGVVGEHTGESLADAFHHDEGRGALAPRG